MGGRAWEREYGYSGPHGRLAGSWVTDNDPRRFDMDGSKRSFATTVRHCLLNPVALGYLVTVAAVLCWVGVDLLFVERQDAGFAGVWAFVVTGPTSWLFLALPGVLPCVGGVVGALFQAAVLGAAYRRVSGRLHHRTGPHGA